MKSTDFETASATVECAVCKKRIPASTALSPEGHDYVFFLCGGVCYAEWERQTVAELEQTFAEHSGVKPNQTED